MLMPPIYKGMKMVCKKSFRFAGRDFKPGDPFPYERMAVQWRKVLQLYDHKKIAPVLKAESKSTEPKKAVSEPDEKVKSKKTTTKKTGETKARRTRR